MSDEPQAEQTVPAAAAMNGTAPAPEAATPDLAATIGREVTLTLRAIEDLNMRMTALQTQLIFVGITVLAAAYLCAKVLAGRGGEEE